MISAATFRVDLRLNVANVQLIILLSGAVQVNPGPFGTIHVCCHQFGLQWTAAIRGYQTANWALVITDCGHICDAGIFRLGLCIINDMAFPVLMPGRYTVGNLWLVFNCNAMDCQRWNFRRLDCGSLR